MTFVSELEPTALWRHFDRILTIPRGSKNEEAIRRHVLAIAAARACDARVDAAGNLVVRKPAAAGREPAPTVVLQSHLDMVNEKNSDVDHDWSRDPIMPRRDDGWVTATGTTLGADNGIGVAAMLAVLEADDVAHGPLELLFTIDEETGLTGAAGLDPDLLAGRCLLNLDSEEEGTLTVGCAGGADSDLRLELDDEAVAAEAVALEVTVRGLKGGHSGVDIHLQRGNAIQLLARALGRARLDPTVGGGFRLAGIGGGNLHNAIPREASALVVCEPADAESLRRSIGGELEAIADEYRPAEPGLTHRIAATTTPAEAWTSAVTDHALALLDALPHGVLAMSYDIPGLVETSTNLATARTSGGELAIGLASRSSVASALAATRRRIRSIGELAGCRVSEGNGYPGWKPDLDSPVLAVLEKTCARVLGSAPEVGAVHAGLECGIIGEKIPGMDMISFGPTIEFPHSPDERVEIASVGRFYELLTTALEELAA